MQKKRSSRRKTKKVMKTAKKVKRRLAGYITKKGKFGAIKIGSKKRSKGRRKTKRRKKRKTRRRR